VMRKHNHSLVRRRAIAVGAIALLVVACDSGARGTVASATVSSMQTSAPKDAAYRMSASDGVAPAAPPTAERANAQTAQNVRFDKGSGDAMLIRHGVASIEVGKLD